MNEFFQRMFWIYVLQKTRGKYARNSLLYLKLLWNQEAKQPGLISHVQILKVFSILKYFQLSFVQKKNRSKLTIILTIFTRL